MPLIEIKTWTDGRVLYAGEHATVREAVEAAIGSCCNLRYCDLRCCNLSCCDLSGCDLSYCDLRYCDLRGCDLRCCDLRCCDLSGCNLSGCNLSGCNLSCCDLAYRSHDLIAEILRRAAGDDTEKLKIAGYVLVCRDKCWDAFAKLAAVDPLGDWALDELAAWVQPGDDAPDILRERAETQHNQEAARP